MNRLIRIGDALSQLVNCILFETTNSNESLSGHAWRVKSRWYKVIDFVCFWEDDHCESAFWNDVIAANDYIRLSNTIK